MSWYPPLAPIPPAWLTVIQLYCSSVKITIDFLQQGISPLSSLKLTLSLIIHSQSIDIMSCLQLLKKKKHFLP